jgi:hypothetical protein
MTAIVWTTLIAAGATVTASLGAVWIKGHYDDRAQASRVLCYSANWSNNSSPRSEMKAAK